VLLHGFDPWFETQVWEVAKDYAQQADDGAFAVLQMQSIMDSGTIKERVEAYNARKECTAEQHLLVHGTNVKIPVAFLKALISRQLQPIYKVPWSDSSCSLVTSDSPSKSTRNWTRC
jgi:hypothetical protein